MRKPSARWRSSRRALHLSAPYLLGTAVVLVTLGAAQLAVTQRARVDLANYTTGLLVHAEDVARASVDGLNRGLRISAEPCGPSDLAELRLIAFHSRYIKDVGRVISGRLLCTAMWGRLPTPVELAPPHRVVRGYSLWRSVPAPGDDRIKVDLASYGNAIVTTAPTAFDRVSMPVGSIGALVISRDGKHHFQSFGDAFDLTLSKDGLAAPLAGHISTRACSNEFDICVVSQAQAGSLLGQPSWIVASILALALVGGGGLGALLKVSQGRRRALHRMLARAIRHGDIDLVYQPLRRLSDRRMVGVEALARWRTLAGVDVPPDTFVPMAEEQGLGTALAKLVIVKSLEEMGPRLRRGDGFYASINLSAQDILDSELRHFLSEQTEAFGVSPADVVLEFTERSTASQQDLADALGQLDQAGFRVYLDDFGTGYSNFAYLADLPLAGLKMDRRFTRAMGTLSPASYAVEAICAMAKALRLPLVAEGVETELQALAMHRLVPEAVGQGWLLGKPCKADSLPDDMLGLTSNGSPAPA